jgi:hypothetical protein
MASYVKYFPFIEHLTNEIVDLFGTTDTFRAAIAAAAYTPAQTHDDLSSVTQITGTGYAAGGDDINNDSTRSSGTITVTAVDVVWTATAADWGSAQEVVVHDDDSTTDKLMCYWDYGTTFTVGNGETFTLDFGASLCTVA